MAQNNETKSRLQLTGHKVAAARPRLLQSGTRGDAAADPFLGDQVVQVEDSFELVPPGRAGAERADVALDRKLIALEAEDGSTIFIRGDKLRDDLVRVHPEAVRADGSIDLAALRDRAGASRGLSDWIWTRLTTLVLSDDGLVGAAKELAASQLKEWLGDEAKELAVGGASWLGAKALMAAIESRLAGEGLYRWAGEPIKAGDRATAAELKQAAQSGPLLIFIHGTGSHTHGAFGDLKSGSASDWNALVKPFGDRVFGFEHRTFSKSPIENALELARMLPSGAAVSLVTHSRGGLVGDLLCLGGLEDKLLEQYRRQPSDADDQSPSAVARRKLMDKVSAEDQGQLRELVKELRRGFRIDRYVRVACPASGTALLSDNLDLFLSSVLSLMGLGVGAVAGPGGTAVFSAFKRIVLEIADKRIDPHLVPGIEAMLVDAPMGALLARAPRRTEVKMAVIAGDIDGGSMLKRIAVLFTDWMFFDSFDNDLVVDTASMYGGLARHDGTYALFDEGAEVSHFAYFRNALTRTALRDWIGAAKPEELAAFKPIDRVREPTSAEIAARGLARAAVTPGSRPVVIVLPGIMGSHLKHGDRVWFDFFDLAMGGLGRIQYGEPGVETDGLFEMFYGDLCEHLERSHEVVRFDYDWRNTVYESAAVLARVVEQKLEETRGFNQPVRLLAHSMGGLVVRGLIARRPELWEQICSRAGGRFVMLGTPNNGSHLMVESLLGKADTVRKLARLDVPRAMQGVLNIIAGFPGALQLLPRPDFPDAGTSPYADYFKQEVWSELRDKNRDRWFGDRIAGVPGKDVLDQAREHWKDPAFTRAIPHAERVAYVYGQAEKTACGLRIQDGVIKMIGTPNGDGSVTWAMGKLEGLPEDRCWYMPATHGDLADTEEHFPALAELLQAGFTAKLGRLPALRGAAETFEYEAPPTGYPTDAELARSVGKRRPRRAPGGGKQQVLEVSVRAMDLRYAQLPVLCGHYARDPIAGAEASIDGHLVDGALRQRHQLGLYAATVGTYTVVLKTPTLEEVQRGSGKGAVVVGLGEYGRLSAADLAETVRAGALAYLVRVLDRQDSGEGASADAECSLGLLALIIGYNSTTNISIAASVEAITRGVCEANRQFADTVSPRLRIGSLQFVEMFIDTAISAAHAVRDLDKRMERDLRRLKVQLRPARELIRDKGVRQRLQAGTSSGYWPRLSVYDADRNDDLLCPPECYDVRVVSPIPDEVRRRLVQLEPTQREGPAAAAPASPAGAPPARAPVPDRLRFTFLGERARAEAVVQQRQPGLVEALIKDAIRTGSYNGEIARTLFQLMVPLDFKGTTRQTDRVILVLDRYTANLPWEMLQADEEPLVIRMAVVRQLVSSNFRRALRTANSRTACVISSPSTQGFYDQFVSLRPANLLPENNKLRDLPSAEKEAETAREILAEKGYDVRFSAPGRTALDVMNRLFEAPYRILVIAAHGEFDLLARDGTRRTGVVLSDGLLLTAAEIGQMEVVPDLVFLNCCHLGSLDVGSSRNRLAASLAAELIEMGVRCVVAAGWQVDDEAASHFAEHFFRAVLTDNVPFGIAIWESRKATYSKYPLSNTWGAYQAYGDPSFVLHPTDSGDESRSRFDPVSVDELVDALCGLSTDVASGKGKSFEQICKRADRYLRNSPAAWQDLPEVQAELGVLYSQLMPEGYEMARAAYLRAIAEDDRTGKVGVRAIEQIANLDARRGEAIGGKPGIELIDSAIQRLNRLMRVAQSTASEVQGDQELLAALPRNVERMALLGSAYKRKAAALAREKDRTWAEVKRELDSSRRAYAAAEGSGPENDRSLWAGINRLQLDGLLVDPASGDTPALLALTKRYADLARKRFTSTFDFFDAIMPADALVAECLLDERLPERVDEVIRTYREAGRSVLRTDRQFDSVVKQLTVLAALLRLRKRPADSKAAEAAERIASELRGAGREPAPAKPPETAAPPAEERPEGKAARARTAKSSAGAKPRRKKPAKPK